MYTAEQLIEKAIVEECIEYNPEADPNEVITPDTVDDIYGKLYEDEWLYDFIYEFRQGEVETDIKCDWSRHYESKSVATEIDGQWVGWTYWYGGGKHAEPEVIPWMEDAYLLDCEEEEKLVIVRKFSKKD